MTPVTGVVMVEVVRATLYAMPAAELAVPLVKPVSGGVMSLPASEETHTYSVRLAPRR